MCNANQYIIFWFIWFTGGLIGGLENKNITTTWLKESMIAVYSYVSYYLGYIAVILFLVIPMKTTGYYLYTQNNFGFLLKFLQNSLEFPWFSAWILAKLSLQGRFSSGFLEIFSHQLLGAENSPTRETSSNTSIYLGFWNEDEGLEVCRLANPI